MFTSDKSIKNQTKKKVSELKYGQTVLYSKDGIKMDQQLALEDYCMHLEMSILENG